MPIRLRLITAPASSLILPPNVLALQSKFTIARADPLRLGALDLARPLRAGPLPCHWKRLRTTRHDERSRPPLERIRLRHHARHRDRG